MRYKFTRIFAFFILITACNLARGVDIQSILRDSQRLTKDGDRFIMLWWIPHLYWELSFGEAKQLTEEGKKQILDLMSDYVLIAVIDGEFDALGGFTGKPMNEITQAFSLRFSEESIDPLPDDKLPDAMKNLLQSMRPVLQNSLGAIGKGMHIIVLPSNAKKQGKWENRKDTLTIKYNDRKFIWRLPLACTLPDKVDADTGEHFPGDYVFNPYSGKKL